MRTNNQESKLALRRHVRTLLNGLTAAQRAAASSRACALLEKQSVWQKAHSILFYAPLPQELDLWPLVHGSLAAGRTVVLPRFDSGSSKYIACRIQNTAGDIVSGQFGIREPADHCLPFELSRLDLVLVPGVAFDLRGRRLGRGRGYYDRLLALVRGTTCGVAFDEQIIAEILVEPHDAQVNCILTPARWIEA
jgi:5-formyltetrahydrofolate cyclo-ligase